MHIGINAQLLSMSNTYRAAGVSNYIYHLLRNLSCIDSTNRYTVFTGTGKHDAMAREALQLGRNFDLRSSSLSMHHPVMRILWEQTAQAAYASRLDVLHCPVNVVPIFSRVPRVVTVHDLAFLLFTDKHLPAKRRYLTLMTRLSARRAAYVVTDSEATRSDVLRLLNIAPEKVVTIPLGVDDEFRYLGSTPGFRSEMEAFRSKRGLPDRYFLYLGTLEPRKNIPQLLRCYAALHQEGTGGGQEIPKLVIAGPKGWMYDQIFALTKELNIAEHVLFPGFLPNDEIVWWYNAALGFIYLSAHEGFGLPPLQAMACGVPVIVSNTSSLPEVVGDAGIQVNPQECSSVTAALRDLAVSADLRDTLRQRGLERAAQFSWERTAEKTLEIYNAAARKRP